MTRIASHAAFAAGLAFAALPALAQNHTNQPVEPSIQALERTFLNPPDDAKPMVRWWWFGAAVTKPELLRELQQMKAVGIGGAELAFVYPEALDDPAKGIKNLPFLSPEMLDAVRYAQTEGRKLGLRIDITLTSGWPYGGPNTPLDEAAERLKTLALPLPQGASSMPIPKLMEGESVIARYIVEGTPDHWQAASNKLLAPPSRPSDDPRGEFPPSPHARVALYMIAAHTRQQVKRAAIGAEGYVLDPFSKQAVATHLAKVGEPLLSAFKDQPPYAIFSDSLEAYGADWTPTLPEEFKKRRGYDLLPHLPELVAGGTPAADKVRHDYGRTLTELVDQNYLTQINDWAKAHGTRFRSQTYGEPAVSLASQRLVALPEGEGPQWRAFSTLRWATSANHLFGNNVTSGETFTWLHSPVFRATPLDMKAEADIDFIMGENQLVFHGWPYSPPASELQPGDPGWSLYAAAALNDHNSWHPVMPAVTAYITRLSWLLRQGQPANQVAVLLPTDDAWANFSPGSPTGGVTVTGAMKDRITPALMSAILSAGYNLDYTDADTINRLGLGTHSILVIPPTDRIPTETLARIASFTRSGGKVIYVGRKPSMDADGNAITPNALPYGRFTKSETGLTADLQASSKPDLTVTGTGSEAGRSLGFIRRKLPGADIYFVTNTSNQPIRAVLRFASGFNEGIELDTETGVAIADRAYPTATRTFAPYASRIFVFDRTSTMGPGIAVHPGTDAPMDLSRDWQLLFPTQHKSTSQTTLTDWTADPATLHYSGECIYTRDFTLTSAPKQPTYIEVTGGHALPGAPDSSPEHPALGPDGLPNPQITHTGPGMHAYYDPPIHEAALVFINGQAAGALWHPPYRLNVGNLLKAGQNHIEIRVYNTALNAWSGIPPRDYGPLKARYGDRFQMQDLDKVTPISSGLLGQIHLVTEEPQ